MISFLYYLTWGNVADTLWGIRAGYFILLEMGFEWSAIGVLLILLIRRYSYIRWVQRYHASRIS
jgi:hypothetical protein